MEKHKDPGPKAPPGKQRTIALLGTYLNFEIPIRIFRETRKMAQKYNYKLLYFAGETYRVPVNYHAQANILYNFIKPQNIDGLIVISNLLSSFTPQQVFMERCKQFAPVPFVSLGQKMENIPSVVLNNFPGMYKAVSHLIQEHHFTRIAYLNGLSDHQDAIERMAAFTRAMEDNGLSVNPDLLLQGNFLINSGSKAASELIEVRKMKPGRDFQAVVCCNDYMASGLVLKLQSMGVGVPEDVAVIGFDNTIFSGCMSPSLSTVNQPYETMAARAVEMLINKLEGKPVPDCASVEAIFIPRNSCGCPDPGDDTDDLFQSVKNDDQFKNEKERILERLNTLIHSIGKPMLLAWKKSLADLREKDQWTHNKGIKNSNYLFIQKVKHHLGETAYNTFKSIKKYQYVTDLGIELIKTLVLSELLKIMANKLPGIGITECCLCLYEDPEHDTERLPLMSRLILAFHQKGVIDLPPKGLRFVTQDLLPREIFRDMEWIGWVILSIYFQEEQIGYIMMDSRGEWEGVFSNLSHQISSVLKGALLFQESKEYSRKLKKENLRIKAEMAVAQNIQTTLLPRNVSEIYPDFQFAASMLPADEVGGDYYDILLDDKGCLWLGIGDVSGHGLKAGLIMILAQTIHTSITTHYDVSPAKALTMINKVLRKNVMSRMNENSFMTCVLLKYQGEGVFQFAGMHLDLLIYRTATKSCESIESEGVWLNVIDDIEDKTTNKKIKLEIGDTLVLYTDGIIESTDMNGELLDMTGLEELVLRHGEKEVEEMKQGILNDVLVHCGNQRNDDITLLVARRIH